jgi:hypothetical protein
LEPLGVITAIQPKVFHVKYGKKRKPKPVSLYLLKLNNLNSSKCITKNTGSVQEQNAEKDRLPDATLSMAAVVFLSRDLSVFLESSV